MSVNLIRYAGVFLTATIAIFALSVVLAALFDFDLPPGLATIIPAMSAAQMEGMHYARARRARLDGGPAWVAALLMTGVALMFTLLLFLVQIAVPGVIDLLSGVPRGFLFGIFALVMGIVFLTNRLFLTIGVMVELRRQARAQDRE